MTDNIKVSVFEHTDESGSYYIERYEQLAKVSDIEYGQGIKSSCEACKKYGANLSCPPYSPYFPEYV